MQTILNYKVLVICELWTYDKRLANAVNEPWVRNLGEGG